MELLANPQHQSIKLRTKVALAPGWRGIIEVHLGDSCATMERSTPVVQAMQELRGIGLTVFEAIGVFEVLGADAPMAKAKSLGFQAKMR